MSACTIAQHHNPPLPFTPKAVIDRLRFRATNGAAYVQLQATKALARILGLYDQTKPLAERLRDPGTAAEPPALPAETGFDVLSEEDLPDEDDEYP